MLTSFRDKKIFYQFLVAIHCLQLQRKVQGVNHHLFVCLFETLVLPKRTYFMCFCSSNPLSSQSCKRANLKSLAICTLKARSQSKRCTRNVSAFYFVSFAFCTKNDIQQSFDRKVVDPKHTCQNKSQ